MGHVWLGRDLESGEPVAVKVLAKSEHQDHSARFLREALLLAQLHHPRIVRYVANGLTDTGEPYLAMEWLEGEDLSQRLQSGPLTVAATVALLRHVAEGLAVAHAADIVHRDMKPSNLFLPGGSVDAVKLVDFGIARLKDSTWTKTGLMLGTPAYMSPEQAYGQRDVDARADLFGLGCVAFECLTGRSAFGGKQVFAVLRKILLEEAPSPAELGPDLPPELVALITRMMAKDAADRPQSAAEVVAALSFISTPSEARAAAPARLVLTEREQRIVTVLSIAEELSTLGTEATTANEVLQPSPDGLDPSGRLRSLLERTGGTLGRCTASSFVLTFPASGLPTDRATQAAECALLLSRVWSGRSMALASGRTELGALMDGNAVDRASRLVIEGESARSATAPATILLDSVTADLLDARFKVAAGPRGLELRGEFESSILAPPARTGQTPFVGREREIAAIRATLEECVNEPVARAVLVTAPAGMGKSRLRRELLQLLSQGAGVQLWTARGEPLRAGLPFGLIAQVTEAAGDAPVNAAAPSTDKSQQAFLELLAQRCATGPVVIVLEDLQWGDALSIKTLDVACLL
jgi:serine/threonine protein kinase